MDFPSSINSLDWDEVPWRPRKLGEVYGSSRNYNGAWQIAGLNGDHVCGTEDQFLNGSPYPYDGPELEYDSDGIPTCCNRKTVGFVKSAARPQATVAHTHTTFIQTKTAIKIQARVTVIHTRAPLVQSCAFPDAEVQFTARPIPQTKTAAFPDAEVQFTARPIPQVGSAAQPHATVYQIHRPPIQVEAGGQPQAEVHQRYRPQISVQSGAFPQAPAHKLKPQTPTVKSAAYPFGQISDNTIWWTKWVAPVGTVATAIPPIIGSNIAVYKTQTGGTPHTLGSSLDISVSGNPYSWLAVNMGKHDFHALLHLHLGQPFDFTAQGGYGYIYRLLPAGATLNGFLARYVYTGTHDLQIFRFDGSTATLIASGNCHAPDADYVLALTVSGNVHTLSIPGFTGSSISASDSYNNTKTVHGFYPEGSKNLDAVGEAHFWSNPGAG